MRKFRLYFDKDKEEAWLNKMCEQGWAMTGFFAGVYTFVPCQPGEYCYRVDMPGEIGRNSAWDKNMREYIDLVEETGAEYVCTWGWWIIFRKEKAKGEFELYTDVESEISLYGRIRKLFLMVGILELDLALLNTGNFLQRLREWSMTQWGDGTDFSWLLQWDWVIFMVCLVILYLAAAGFFAMVFRITKKICSLQK